MPTHDVGGFSQPRGGLKLALCRNDFRAPLTLCFGLFGHGALHLLRQIHVFDFDGVDLDAPLASFGIQNRLQAVVDALDLGKQIVKFELPQHVA
jgi:hypothetical protein